MEDFYSQWVTEQERLLHDLISVPPIHPDLQISLISRALSLYAEYYDHLHQLADRDIFLVLSAYWLTPFERSFLWLGGLKPDMLFHFMPPDINDDQRGEIEMLKQQTVIRVAELETIMREVEVTMTALVTITALHGRSRNGEARAEAEMRVIHITHTVFHDADKLRKYVVTRQLEVLSTTQAVQFLAWLMNHQISIRQYGLHHIARV